MERICELVRFRPYERGLALINSPVERLRRNAVKLRREKLLELGEYEFDKLARTSYHVLKHSRLRLVHCRGCALRKRRAVKLIAGMQLIKRMTALMYDAVH